MPVIAIDLQAIFRPDGKPYKNAANGLHYLNQTYNPVLLYSSIPQEPREATELFARVDQSLEKNADGLSRCTDIVICGDPRRIKCDWFVTSCLKHLMRCTWEPLLLDTSQKIARFWGNLALESQKPRGISTVCTEDWSKTKLVDMDGVIYDLFGHAIARFKAKHPNFVLPQMESYILQNNFPPEHREELNNIIGEPEFFLELPLILGSKEGIETLSRHYADLCICSTPYLPEFPRYNTIEQKLVSLERDRIRLFFSDLIFCRRKYLVHAGGIIDDSTELAEHNSDTFKVITFTQPHNERFKAPLRLNNWLEIPRLLTKLGKAV